MARKNLYIADEHEPLIERLEKALEQRGQSLSEFFIQSVKNSVPTAARGHGQGKTKVCIPAGAGCAVAVDAAWRHSTAVSMLIGPPDNPSAKASGSSLLFAKVLSADDPVGLWIELNSEQKRNPGYPVLQFAIPWRFVLGVCVDRKAVPFEKAIPGFNPGAEFTNMAGQQITMGAERALDSLSKGGK